MQRSQAPDFGLKVHPLLEPGSRPWCCGGCLWQPTRPSGTWSRGRGLRPSRRCSDQRSAPVWRHRCNWHTQPLQCLHGHQANPAWCLQGFLWMSNAHTTAYYWSHAGQHFEIRDEGDWCVRLALLHSMHAARIGVFLVLDVHVHMGHSCERF